MDKKLYKINEGKKLCGVCGGVAEYLKMDVSIVRILWVVLTVCASIGLWLYIACALILPEKPENVIDAAPVEDHHETID